MSFTRVFRCCAFLLSLLAFADAPRLCAQGARSGTSPRSTNTTGRSGVTRGVSSGGTGRSVSGARQYRSNTELGDATITIDPETRSLVIVTDEETHAELEKVIKTLDQIKPQVLIKVVFVEVTYNKGSDIGIEANYIFDQSSARPAAPGATTTTATVNNGTTTTNVVTKGAAAAVAAGATRAITAASNYGLSALTDGTFVRVLTDDWSATLRALATHGKVEVLSRPSIMARNNQEAVIVVGNEVPFVTNSRTDALGQLNNTIEYDDIGIILRVTPFITSEGTVEMIVAPEISTLTDRTVPISNTASAPVIAKRSAETVVVTPNGQTVVIGGLMETQRVESVRKVPILGDIPLIGLAFKRTVKDNVKRELLIFLTPHIVNTPRGVQQLTSRELENSQLVNRAFTEEERDTFIESPTLFPEPELPSDKEIKRPVITKTSTTSTTVTRMPAAAPAAPKPKILPPAQLPNTPSR